MTAILAVLRRLALFVLESDKAHRQSAARAKRAAERARKAREQ